MKPAQNNVVNIERSLFQRLLEKTGLGRELQEEERAMGERAQAMKDIPHLERRRDRELPALQKAEADAYARCEKVYDELQRLRVELYRASNAKADFLQQIEMGLSRARCVLRETADSDMIQHYLAQLEAELDRTAQVLPITVDYWLDRVKGWASNREQRGARLDAIHRAIYTVRNEWPERGDFDHAAEFEALWNGLPAVGAPVLPPGARKVDETNYSEMFADVRSEAYGRNVKLYGLTQEDG